MKPGALAYVDGPFGHTSIDSFPDADRYFYVAGGIGVAPCISMLRTLADRGDRRPHTLVYGSADWDSATFREELAELASRIDLKVVHVLAHPPLGWLGETGTIGMDLIERHLPRSGRRICFVYGPGPLIDDVEALAELEREAARGLGAGEPFDRRAEFRQLTGKTGIDKDHVLFVPEQRRMNDPGSTVTIDRYLQLLYSIFPRHRIPPECCHLPMASVANRFASSSSSCVRRPFRSLLK